eukprot:5347801-Prorocentrum_lima.AAC.1
MATDHPSTLLLGVRDVLLNFTYLPAFLPACLPTYLPNYLARLPTTHYLLPTTDYPRPTTHYR